MVCVFVEVCTVLPQRLVVVHIEVCHDAASGVVVCSLVQQQFARCAVAVVHAVGFLLMHHECLQTWAVHVKVTSVEGIAVAQTGAIERGAVGLHGSGAIDNLLLAVAIHVGNGNPVAALAIHCLAQRL